MAFCIVSRLSVPAYYDQMHESQQFIMTDEQATYCHASNIIVGYFNHIMSHSENAIPEIDLRHKIIISHS